MSQRAEVQIYVMLHTCSCDLVWGGKGDDLSAYQVVPNFRVRTIPVLGPIPAVFGMAAAAYVLTELARQPIVSEPIYSLRMNQYQTLYDRLVTRAEERWGAPCRCPVTCGCLLLNSQDRPRGVLSCLRVRLRGAFPDVARIVREVADTARSEAGAACRGERAACRCCGCDVRGEGPVRRH